MQGMTEMLMDKVIQWHLNEVLEMPTTFVEDLEAAARVRAQGKLMLRRPCVEQVAFSEEDSRVRVTVSCVAEIVGVAKPCRQRALLFFDSVEDAAIFCGIVMDKIQCALTR